MPDPNQSIPSKEYTHTYYQSCEGYAEFKASQGMDLPERLRIPRDMAHLSPGMRVVDIGCGRGEIVFQAALAETWAWGLDYSHAAVEIAHRNLGNALPGEKIKYSAVQQSSALALPFASDSINCIFMLDIVEHLTPLELHTALLEAFRILKPGGRLIVHTMPNLWYYHFGYPIFRWIQGLRGQSLPVDPRQRWDYSFMHINEQTPRSLHNAVQKANFYTRTWLQNTQTFENEHNIFVRWGMKFLSTVYPFRFWFCNDIFSLGLKPE
jgi:ubiquinone/menaquinone biosynthesis C-methylase UbiE